MSERYPCQYSSTALMCVMGSIQAVVFALCLERDWSQWKLGWNIRLFTVAYSGIFASGLVVSLIAWGVMVRGPLFVSVFNPLMLVLVALMGSILLNEKLHLGRPWSWSPIPIIRIHPPLPTIRSQIHDCFAISWERGKRKRVGDVGTRVSRGGIGSHLIVSVREHSVIGAALIVCGLYVVLWGKGKEMKRMARLMPSKSSRESEPIEVVVANSFDGTNTPNNSTIGGTIPEADTSAAPGGVPRTEISSSGPATNSPARVSDA